MFFFGFKGKANRYLGGKALAQSDFEKNGQSGNEDIELNQDEQKNTPPSDDEGREAAVESADDSPDIPPAEDEREELENLAKLFQEEYDKTLKEAEEEDAESPDTLDSDAPEAEETEDNDSPEDVAEEDLCVRCGKRERDLSISEDYEYCSRCREEMINKRVPFVSSLFKVLSIFAAFISIILFLGSYPAFLELAEGDKAVRENKIDSAIQHYASAIKNYESLNSSEKAAKGYVFAKFVPQSSILKAKLVKLLYENGYVTDVESYITTYFTERQLKNPLLRNVKNLKAQAAEFTANLQKAYSVIYNSLSLVPEEIPYEELAAKLDEMKNTPSEGETKNGAIFRQAAASTYKYYIAFVSGQGFDVQIAALEDTKALVPEAYWLYGHNLAFAYAKSGEKDKALSSVEELKKYNAEDSTPYAVEAAAFRVAGELDSAIAAANKGYELNPRYGYECLRQRAIAELLKGDVNTAFDTMNKVFTEFKEMDSYEYLMGEMGDTYAIICLAAGKTENYENLMELYEAFGYKQRTVLKDYKDGKLTLEQIFLEGKADVA